MKARILILMAAAVAALNISCAPKKSVEEKLAEFTEWNESFMDSYREGIMALNDDPDAAEAFADSC